MCPIRAFVVATILCHRLLGFLASWHLSRPTVLQIERGLTEEKEAAAQALAKEVARATLAEIQGMFDRDLDILKKKLPSKPEQAVESALDMKYLRERQLSLSQVKLF